MSGYSDMLLEKRSKVWNDAKALLDRAAAARRELTADEQRHFDQLTNDLAEQRQAIEKLTKVEADHAAAEESLRKLSSIPAERRGAYVSTEERAIGDQFRSAILEKNPAPIFVNDEQARTLWNPGIELRAMSTSAPANATMGVGFYGKLVQNLVESSSVLAAGATVVTTENGEPIRIPRQTAYSSATLVAEGAALPEADPTLGAVTLGAFKYAVLITVSNELAEDSAFDLAGYLAAQAGVALGNALGADLINGAGTTAPRGALLDATLGVTGPTGTATSFGSQSTAGQGTDLLSSLYGSVAEPYTRSPAAAFLARNGTQTAVRNLKASTGELVGSTFLAQSPAPWFVDPNVPAIVANAKSVLFGDWSRYFVRMVNGVRFEMSRDYAFGTDQTAFRAILRADGALIDNTGAIKYFQHSAT